MRGKSGIWQFFWISLLRGWAVLGGLILFIIPGIIFSIWFSLSLYILVAEGLKGTSAIKQNCQDNTEEDRKGTGRFKSNCGQHLQRVKDG